MTEPQDNNHSQQDAPYEEIEYVVQVRRRHPLRRIGCGILLVFWFLILLLPLFFIILAVEGEIRIENSDYVPDRHEHPRFLITLIMDADARGLQITNSSIVTSDVTDQSIENMCVQTNVRYILWQGEGEAASFCDCYTRDLTLSMESWEYQETIMDACE